MSTPIAITGLGVVTHRAYGVDALWHRLITCDHGLKIEAPFDLTGMRCTRNTICDPHWSRNQLSQRFADVAVLLDEGSSAGTIHGAGAAAQALSMAGLGLCAPKGMGFVLGCTSGGAYDALTERAVAPTHAIHHASLSTLARIFGITGPVAQISNACTSSIAAISHAIGMIRQGRAERVLCGGADHARRTDFAGFNALRAMSPTACKAFDQDRDGMIIGDGAAMLVLESTASAKERGAEVLAWITGHGLSSDGYHATRPTPEGLSRAILIALAEAQVTSDKIGYVNCHGTGTPHNDVTEARALSDNFSEGNRPVLASTKTTTGHLLGSAAALEAVISVLVLRNGLTPPMSHSETQDPDIAFPTAMGAAAPISQSYALSTTLGFGGSNGCLVLKRPTPEMSHAA